MSIAAAMSTRCGTLAPDGTELGIVASPRAVGLAFRAIAAVRELAAQPDLAPAKPQIDLLVEGDVRQRDRDAEPTPGSRRDSGSRCSRRATACSA